MSAMDVGAEVAAHEATYRVRFDEAGPDGLLRTSGLLRYAQDVAWLHSTERGFDRDWYAERGLTWLVRAAELEVLAPVRLGETLISKTRVAGQRRVWARRRGEFRLVDGTLAGWVHTDWVLIDGRGTPIRIPEVFAEVFRIPETKDVLTRVPLSPTPTDRPVRTFAVRPHELDPMDHVNNAVYLDWLEEAALAAEPAVARAALTALPRRYRLEYAFAAGGGDALADAAWLEPDGSLAYRLTGPGGTDVFRATIAAGGSAADHEEER